MRFINLLLLGAIVLGLEACTVKVTDRKGAEEATGAFLNEYAEKGDLQSSDLRTDISRNGSISFRAIVNERCTISLYGRIDRATLSYKSHYIVRYHYDRVTSPGWTCAIKDSPSCVEQLESCERARDKYFKRSSQSGTVIVRVGEEAKNVILFP